MLVELNCLANRGIVFLAFEVAEQASLLFLGSASYSLDYCQRINSLMNMQGDSIHHKAGPFGLTRPLELRVEMRIKLVGFLAVQMVRLSGHQTDRRIVQSLLIVIGILLNFATFDLSRHLKPSCFQIKWNSLLNRILAVFEDDS